MSPDASPDASPVEGPTRPDADAAEPTPTNADAPTDSATPVQPPPPSFKPEDAPGIEFRVPSPQPEPVAPPEDEDPQMMSFPDPGMAPNDGSSMLVLGGTTIGLTLVAFGAGLSVGLRNRIPLEWLLPSTIVPAVGVLAFAGGGMYLGIKRARAYRRWEIGNRVIGSPQGGGLAVGGSFMLLAALGFIPSGAFALSNGEVTIGATMIAVGSVAAVSMPIMFTLSSRRQREYQATGGWRRKPIPELPPGAIESDEGEFEGDEESARLQIVPLVHPISGGAMVGAAGRF